jgi:hypothetical protein
VLLGGALWRCSGGGLWRQSPTTRVLAAAAMTLSRMVSRWLIFNTGVIGRKEPFEEPEVSTGQREPSRAVNNALPRRSHIPLMV